MTKTTSSPAASSRGHKFKYEATHCHHKGLLDDCWVRSFFHYSLVFRVPWNRYSWSHRTHSGLRTRIISGIFPNYLSQESASGVSHFLSLKVISDVKTRVASQLNFLPS